MKTYAKVTKWDGEIDRRDGLQRLARTIKWADTSILEYFSKGENKRLVIGGGEFSSSRTECFLLGGRHSLAVSVTDLWDVTIVGAPTFNVWYCRFPAGLKTVTVIYMTPCTYLFGKVPKDKFWTNPIPLRNIESMALPQIVKEVLDCDRRVGKALVEVAVLNQLPWE